MPSVKAIAFLCGVDTVAMGFGPFTDEVIATYILIRPLVKQSPLYYFANIGDNTYIKRHKGS